MKITGSTIDIHFGIIDGLIDAFLAMVMMGDRDDLVDELIMMNWGLRNCEFLGESQKTTIRNVLEDGKFEKMEVMANIWWVHWGYCHY